MRSPMPHAGCCSPPLQSLLLAAAAAPSGGLAQLLPQQLVGRWAREDKEDEQRQRGEGGEEVKLRIAWQYRRYIKASQQRDGGGRGGRGGGGGAAASRGAAAVGGSGGPAPQESRQPGSRAGGAAGGLKDWCHRFDLTRGLGEEGLQVSAVLRCCCGPMPFSAPASPLPCQRIVCDGRASSAGLPCRAYRVQRAGQHGAAGSGRCSVPAVLAPTAAAAAPPCCGTGDRHCGSRVAARAASGSGR